MRIVKWPLFAVLCLTYPAVVGCMGGHIINASTVEYVRYHGTMPWEPPNQSHKAKPKPVIPAHLSQTAGLGDTDAFLDTVWGKPSKVVLPIGKNGSGSAYYSGELIFVQFENNRAADLTWKPKTPVPISSAVKTTRTMLPKDARLAQTVTMTSRRLSTWMSTYQAGLACPLPSRAT